MPLPIVFLCVCRNENEKIEERERVEILRNRLHALRFLVPPGGHGLNLHLFPLVHLFSRNHLHVSLILWNSYFSTSLSLSLSLSVLSLNLSGVTVLHWGRDVGL